MNATTNQFQSSKCDIYCTQGNDKVLGIPQKKCDMAPYIFAVIHISSWKHLILSQYRCMSPCCAKLSFIFRFNDTLVVSTPQTLWAQFHLTHLFLVVRYRSILWKIYVLGSVLVTDWKTPRPIGFPHKCQIWHRKICTSSPSSSYISSHDFPISYVSILIYVWDKGTSMWVPNIQNDNSNSHFFDTWSRLTVCPLLMFFYPPRLYMFFVDC